jgi:hypothetical protein
VARETARLRASVQLSTAFVMQMLASAPCKWGGVLIQTLKNPVTAVWLVMIGWGLRIPEPGAFYA